MTTNQKVLQVYLSSDRLRGRNAKRVAERNEINRKLLSYINTVAIKSNGYSWQIIQQAIAENKKVKFNNGEVTSSLEMMAKLLNDGYKVISYGNRATTIYLLECEKKIKIGIAKNISKILQPMQLGNPYKINFVQEYRVDDESRAKAVVVEVCKSIEDKRLQGDWFDLTVAEVHDLNTSIREKLQ